jgi:hypothetical protein
MKLLSEILFAADRCELELLVSFWYTPGDEWSDPEIDFDAIEDIYGIITPSGVSIDADWLIDRGYYDDVLEFANKQIRQKLVPGSRVWQDLIWKAEKC